MAPHSQSPACVSFEWLCAHASIVLFVNLSCGIAGVPLLSEALLLISGALVARGDRAFVDPFIAAVAGCAIGMTISFALGRSGRSIAERCAPLLRLPADRFESLRDRCRRYARPMVLCSYFMPGLRHVTAIAVGASGARPDGFLSSAVAGACAWTALLLWTGMTAGAPAAVPSFAGAWYVPIAWTAALGCGAWMIRTSASA